MGRPEPVVLFAQTILHSQLDEYVDEVRFTPPPFVLVSYAICHQILLLLGQQTFELLSSTAFSTPYVLWCTKLAHNYILEFVLCSTSFSSICETVL